MFIDPLALMYLLGAVFGVTSGIAAAVLFARVSHGRSPIGCLSLLAAWVTADVLQVGAYQAITRIAHVDLVSETPAFAAYAMIIVGPCVWFTCILTLGMLRKREHNRNR
jgi:hypothetical protein